MKRFKVVVNGTPFEVDVEELSSGAVAPIAPQTASAPTPAAVAAAPAKVTAETPAPAPAKENPAAKTTAVPAQAGPGTIVAPMPGVIVTIKVKPGQVVKRRDVLLTLEAMKMENEILAPKDGCVKEIYVHPGQSVNPQDPLVDLE